MARDTLPYYWIVTDESECDDRLLCVIKVKTSHCGYLLRHPIICLHTLVSQHGVFQHHLHVDLNIYLWYMFAGHQN